MKAHLPPSKANQRNREDSRSAFHQSKTLKKPPRTPHATNSSQAIAAALEKEIIPEWLVAALSEAQNATSVSRSGVVELDYRTRPQAVSLILNYQVGRPNERETPIPDLQKAVQYHELVADFGRSPALLKEIQELLNKAEAAIANR